MLLELTATALLLEGTCSSNSWVHGRRPQLTAKLAKTPASRDSSAAPRITSVPNRAEPDNGAGRFAGKRIVSIRGRWGAERRGRWGAYDDDFEEVGLLGRERRPHGYGGGGAARRGAAARTLGRG